MTHNMDVVVDLESDKDVLPPFDDLMDIDSSASNSLPACCRAPAAAFTIASLKPYF